MGEDQEKMMNLRTRRKKSSKGIICCFTGTTKHHRHASFDLSSYSSTASQPSPSSRSGWFKSKNYDVPEIKGKCRSFISRIGRHRRHASAEFSYDPLSYSLNFNDDADDDSRAMSFSTRFSAISSPRGTPHAFDHESPRSPDQWKGETTTATTTQPRMEGGHLGRGLESLAEKMKTNRGTAKVPPQRRTKSGLSSSSPRVATGEEVASPVGISSNREILVQLC